MDDKPSRRELSIPVALVLPITAAVGAALFVAFSRSTYFPSPSFYGVAAQVIPVLLVVFAVERRAVEFLSDPRAKLYRLQLFLFLLIGELAALIAATGALSDFGPSSEGFQNGLVASSPAVTNVLAGITAAGLVGGFVMIAVLALGGPGWISVSRGDPEQ